jgi:hypothetical protein
MESRRWRKAGRTATESSGLAGFDLASVEMLGVPGPESRGYADVGSVEPAQEKRGGRRTEGWCRSRSGG